jgi:hypothetical protein
MSSGKWYFEFCGVNSDNTWMLGIGDVTKGLSRGYTGSAGDGLFVYVDGDRYAPTSASSYGVSWTHGDVMGVAVDMDNNAMYFAKNNTWMDSGVPTSGSTKTGAAYTTELVGKTWVAAMGRGGTNNTITGTFNFGQDSSFAGAKTAQGNGGDGEDFYYTPPTGYKALNTDNLPDPAIALPTDHFNSLAFTGTGSVTKNVTGVGFQPDFVWLKTRVNAASHALFDSVRGTNKVINSNTANAEASDSGAGFSAFDSDGFTVVEQVSAAGSINDSEGMISWNFKAGGTASSNSDGSITSSVSANPTAGFSIVSYTSPGTSADGTIGHGLSQAPELVIVKNRDSAYNWDVWNTSLSSGYDLILNTTAAQTSGRWSTTIPTASLVSLKDTYEVNGTDKYIAYCFHSVEGYSKIGSYVGNGVSQNGPFVYLGFKPAFLMVKNISATAWWGIWDNKRDPDNTVTYEGYPNSSVAEGNNTGSTNGPGTFDFLSNGFKGVRKAAESMTNTSGNTYIYMAFAETPFSTSNAR